VIRLQSHLSEECPLSQQHVQQVDKLARIYAFTAELGASKSELERHTKCRRALYRTGHAPAPLSRQRPTVRWLERYQGCARAQHWAVIGVQQQAIRVCCNAAAQAWMLNTTDVHVLGS
jgi:hypothetical protein